MTNGPKDSTPRATTPKPVGARNAPRAGASADDGKLRRRHDAQQLAFRAMELLGEGRSAEAVALCREALGIHPDCVDARLIVADVEIESVPDFLEAVGDACDAGIRDLGEDFFENNAGRFWGLVETRPYMRALGMLAETLREQGRRQLRAEAVEIYLEMLALNPDDNQGVRMPLASLLLSLRQPKSASAALAAFPKDKSPIMQWLRACASFALGDLESAERLARAADAQNAEVMTYALGLAPMPRAREALVALRRPREVEALHAAELLKPVLKHSKPLRAWLLERRARQSNLDPQLQAAAQLLVAAARRQ